MITYFDKTTETVFANLEKTQKEFWNISRVTGEFLYNLIKTADCNQVLEIGTSNGYSGLWIGKALKETGGRLTTIEFYEKRLSIARENFAKCGLDDIITTVQGSACEILRSLPDSLKLDFVFIDANKREYIEYFELINPHLNAGGYIACDNVLSHQEKTKPFIDAINRCPDYENTILDLPAGLSLAQKLR